jgi:hypothetical protein
LDVIVKECRNCLSVESYDVRGGCEPSSTDDAWGAVCDSLKTHSTLEVFDLVATPIKGPLVPPDVVKSRMQAPVDMVKVNTLIHTIRVDSLFSENEIYQDLVISHLETNRFRPRLLAIQAIRPIA